MDTRSLVELKGVRWPELPEWWPKLLPWVYAAMDKGRREETAEDVFEACQVGDYQLWAILRNGKPVGALVTDIFAHKQRTYGQVKYVAGEGMEEWLCLLGALEDWFGKRGADGVLLAGRKGWERVAKRHGYELDSVVMRKDL